VAEISLSPGGANQKERLLVFVDRTRNLFIHDIGPLFSGSERRAISQKLASQVSSFAWSDECEILTAVSDKRLIAWFYPRAAFVDKDLLVLASITKDAHDLGESPTIKSWEGSAIRIELEDGSKIHSSVPQFPSMLHNYVNKNQWDSALKLCRFLKSREYWGTLAGFSIHHSKLDIAETALCALQTVDKVEYIKFIQSIPTIEVGPNETCVIHLRLKSLPGNSYLPILLCNSKH